MAKLLLIRHAHPHLDPETPPSTWKLSEEGVDRAGRLADRLSGRGIKRIFTSTELKSIETGRICADRLGVPCEQREGLEEQNRTGVGFLPNEVFLRGVRDLFQRPNEQVMGIETGLHAAERMERTLLALTDRIIDDTETLACVSHGTIISLYAAHSLGVDGLELWQRLGMPSTLHIDTDSKEILEVIETY